MAATTGSVAKIDRIRMMEGMSEDPCAMAPDYLSGAKTPQLYAQVVLDLRTLKRDLYPTTFLSFNATVNV